ncbi:hypothetical protein D3C78_1286150 [compost metagenome]
MDDYLGGYRYCNDVFRRDACCASDRVEGYSVQEAVEDAVYYPLRNTAAYFLARYA